jgi:four helix bundle protein
MNEKLKFKLEFKRRLYAFVLRLIRFVDSLPRDGVSRRMGDQLLRSGTSILANYIEGQAAGSRKDFINYFNHSLKSTNESKLWVSLLKDSRRTNSPEAEWLLKELNEIGKIFGSSILTLKGKK